MVERASQRIPVLLECGHTILVDEAELDWNAKYYCGICGHDFCRIRLRVKDKDFAVAFGLAVAKVLDPTNFLESI